MAIWNCKLVTIIFNTTKLWLLDWVHWSEVFDFYLVNFLYCLLSIFSLFTLFCLHFFLANGRIEHNDYHYNLDGCVYVNNEDDFILEIQPVDLLIFENRFKNNYGPYVLNLGLSHYDYRGSQKLDMRFNWVQNNLIKEPWKGN